MAVTYQSGSSSQQLDPSQGLQIDLTNASPEVIAKFREFANQLAGIQVSSGSTAAETVSGTTSGPLRTDNNGRLVFSVAPHTISLLQGQGDNDARYNAIMGVLNQVKSTADNTGLGYQVGNYKVEERGTTESQQLATANVTALNGSSIPPQASQQTINAPATVATTITQAKTYKAGDANPRTGFPLTQPQADSLNSQATQMSGQSTGTIQNSTPAASQGTTATAATPATATSGNTEGNAAAMKILSDNFNSGAIDFGTYNFFKTAIEKWDPSSEINYGNILTTFNDIAKNTVDPYFQEQAKMYIDDTQRSIKALNDNKALNDSSLNDQTKQNTLDAQKNLNNSGMTFTGDAIKQLGASSAFAQPGTPEAAQSAIPLQQPGFGGTFETGTVNNVNKSAVSSANLRYQQQLEDIARNAEKALGSTQYGSLGTGVSALGGITGSLNEQSSQAKGTALTNTYNQELNNYEAKKPVDIIK